MDETEKASEKRTPLGDEPQETSSGRGGIGGGQGTAPGANRGEGERSTDFPEGVDETRGSRAGQGILKGQEQNAMKPMPASQPQEGMPAHLEGGPHEPATQKGRSQQDSTQGSAQGHRSEGASQPSGSQQGGGRLPEGAQSHITNTDLQGDRSHEAPRGATGGTQQRQSTPGSTKQPPSRSRPDMGQPQQRSGGSPQDTGGVGTTVGGNAAEEEETEKETKGRNAGVTGGTSTSGDVPGGGGRSGRQ